MPTAVLAMMPTILSLISQLPSVEQSVEALVKSVLAMHSAGGGAQEIADALQAAIPAMTKAVVANTPAMTQPQMPAG